MRPQTWAWRTLAQEPAPTIPPLRTRTRGSGLNESSLRPLLADDSSRVVHDEQAAGLQIDMRRSPPGMRPMRIVVEKLAHTIRCADRMERRIRVDVGVERNRHNRIVSLLDLNGSR